MRTHKTCKECGVTHELCMFHKKGSKYNKLRSKCKICDNISSRSYTVYYYPTIAMQQEAARNTVRIDREIVLGKPKCYKCNEIVNRRGKLCSSCKSVTIKAKRKVRDKKRSKIKERNKAKNLSNSYVKSVLVQHKDRMLFGISRKDISQDLVDLKRKQLSLQRQLK